MKEIVIEILKEAKEELEKNLKNSFAFQEVSSGGIFGDLEDDVEIGIDQLLGQFFQERFKESNLFHRITVEGLDEKINSSAENDYWVCIDPLDGSLNLQKGAILGNSALPYSGVVTILRKSYKAKFEDIVMAAVIDYRNGNIWFAERLPNGRIITTFNDLTLQNQREKSEKVDIGKMILIGEMYYSNNRNILSKAFNNQSGWLRNPGSAGYEMVLVSIGQVAGYFCISQKQHESGAAFLINKGAGCACFTIQPQSQSWGDMGELDFLFNHKDPVIFAGNEELAMDILNRVKNR